MPTPSDCTEDGQGLRANVTIHVADLNDPSGCTLIPNSVLDDDRLSPETRLVYVMLRRLAATSDGQPIDQRELARRIVISAQRIPRHLALLQRMGLIQLVGQPARYNGDPPLSPRTRRAQGRPSRTGSGTAERRLAERLIVIGVDPQVARFLVASYPKEQVAGALRAAHRHHPKPGDPAAWVIAAVRQGWAAPDAAVAARQRQLAQEQAIVAWEQRADAALAALPAEVHQSLRRQATEVVERLFDQRLAATNIGVMLVTAELRRLVAEQAGLPSPDALSPSLD